MDHAGKNGEQKSNRGTNNSSQHQQDHLHEPEYQQYQYQESGKDQNQDENQGQDQEEQKGQSIGSTFKTMSAPPGQQQQQQQQQPQQPQQQQATKTDQQDQQQAATGGKKARKTGSLESTSSSASTSSQRISGGRDAGYEYATTASVTTSYGKNLADVVAVLVYCPKHHKFALVPCPSHRGLWLPYVMLKQSEGWYSAIVNRLRSLFGLKVGVKSSSVFTPPEIMHIMRIQLPEVFKYVTRVVFMTALQTGPGPLGFNSGGANNAAITHGTPMTQPLAGATTSPGATTQGAESQSVNQTIECCQDGHQGVRWLKHETILKEEQSLEIWGPEPGILTLAFATNSVERGAYSEYTLREAMRFQPREVARTFQEEMLKSCHFERGDILRLYSDYVQHCYPSQNMNYVSFQRYMHKIGYDSSNASLDINSLFRAFRFNHMPYVTFHELLLGLAAMDRNTQHGGHSGEVRCAYIFRYYDSNGDGQLTLQDIHSMATDGLKRKNSRLAQKTGLQASAVGAGAVAPSVAEPSASKNKLASSVSEVSAASVKKDVERIYNSIGVKYGDTINEMLFMRAVGSMQLRGTSSLFRSNVSVLPIKQHYETIVEKHALTDIEGNLVGGEIQRKGTCPRCKEKKYVLALHTVKLTRDAQIVEPTEVRFDEYPPPISRAQRQLSRAVFASDSTPNKLIDMVTAFWTVLGTRTNPSELKQTAWEKADRQTLADDIRRVCQQSEAIFKREARIVGVTSPCYVLGDIHGNLKDLRCYERVLWPHAPTCITSSYLFLGDYVDRGDYGLECIIYLLSMKVLAPKAFFLLRGNHELRSIQQAFTFFREVCEKFRNQQLGTHVWETLNKCFDLMPVAATIDDQIYCAHGGIPTSATRLDELVNIPSPLIDPEHQSPAAWEILWNDPVSSTEYTEYADLLRKQPGGQAAVSNMQGFLPNTKRGTAFFFSEEAIKRFLHVNTLSHVIRAHECVPPGYALHCNGKVMTVFSSSHYCGATNDAACILVEREKIRIIRLETD